MCDRLGAMLLYYPDEYPSINGWLFGSMKTGRPLWDDALRENFLRPALLRMAAKSKLKGVPEGTGFHAFRHAYNALLVTVSGTADEVKVIQMKLLRHGDKATNDGYGKSAKPLRDQARTAHTAVAELAMGGGFNLVNAAYCAKVVPRVNSDFRYLVDLIGAGDRDRTGDIQLGKLTFYH